jgi:putative endonuclease
VAFFVLMAYLYILYAPSIDRYYVGHTESLPQERLKKHLADHNGYTAKAKDWAIVRVETFPSKADAYRRERQIKAWKSKKKIQNLLLEGG